MKKYGIAAVKAVSFLGEGHRSDPNYAWEKACAEIFPNSRSLREKGCPRYAFLGLCEEGKIENVPSGNYTGSKKNKRYALIGLSLLQGNPSLQSNANELWNKVLRNIGNVNGKAHNSQMDVVIALFQKKLTI